MIPVTMTQEHDNINRKIQQMIQFMISHGCVPDKQFQEVAIKIIDSISQPQDGQVSKLIHDVNKRLNPYNMMIRTLVDDITMDKYHILISTVDNEITHAATRYNPKQVEFFKQLLQSIVHSAGGAIPYTSVKSCAEKAMLPSSTKYRSTKYECELLFREWTSKKWFEMVEEAETDLVTLGVRSIAELDVFIKQKLIDGASDLDCRNCDTMSIYSALCNFCDSRYHKRCAKISIDPETGKCRKCPDDRNSSSSQISTPIQSRKSSSASRTKTRSSTKKRRTSVSKA